LRRTSAGRCGKIILTPFFVEGGWMIHGPCCLIALMAVVTSTVIAGQSTSARSGFDAPGFEGLFDKLHDTISRHRQAWHHRGKMFHLNHPWIRDNIHMMKGYKYWDEDPGSFVDVLLELQHADGFFYEIVGRSNHDHLPLVGEKHKRIEQ